MINTIIFTKNRPLQLNATLDSMRFYTNFHSICNILVIDGSEEKTPLDSDQGVDIVLENELGGFGPCLKEVLKEIPDDEIILFCVDDLIFLDFFNPNLLVLLQQNPKLIGFSLRLGTNINGYSDSEIYHQYSNLPINYVEWQKAPSHWGYPFEVSCSAYSAKLVKEVVGSAQHLRLPNDLESAGYHYCFNSIKNDKPFYAFLNGPSRSSCADINRVQDLYQNRTQGGSELTADKLDQLFKEGYRIDWKNYFGHAPIEPFMGTDKFNLIKVEND